MSDTPARFGIEGFASVERDPHGLERVAITTPLANAHIYLHGSHLTHFQPRDRRPILFLSAKSLFQPGKAIRGGVPLIFPWFGPNAADTSLPAHGFARTRAWNLEAITRRGDEAVIEMSLAASDATRALWPHDFELRYRASVGAALEMALTVHNTGAAPFTFEEALHTYLSVEDVRRVCVHGLAGKDYLDKVRGGRRFTEGSAPLTITQEVDRVYVGTRADVTVDDSAADRRLLVSKSDSDATVVWNPWIDRARALADFGDEEWPQMLCIESGNIGESAVTLPPGAEHTMTAIVSSL